MAVQYTTPTTLRINFVDDTWIDAFPDIYSVVNASTIPWLISDTFLYEEANTLRSGATGHSSTSEVTFTFTLAEAGSVSFMYCVSSESSYDKLYVVLDNTTVLSPSGTVQWTKYSKQLDAGTHTLTFRYSKDGSSSVGSDAGAIGYIELLGVIPNFNTHYLVHDVLANKWYANKEGSLTEVTVAGEAPTLQDFIDVGGLIPTSDMLSTLYKYRVLKCYDSLNALGFTNSMKLSATCNAKPQLFKYKNPVKVSEQYQVGFKSIALVATKADTTTIKVLLSQDGITWMRYNAPVTQEVTAEDGTVSEEVVTPGSWSNVDFTTEAALASGMTIDELAAIDVDAFGIIYTEGVTKELYVAFAIQCTELDDWCISSIRVAFTTTLEQEV